jgi:hypothetical protein
LFVCVCVVECVCLFIVLACFQKQVDDADFIF